MSRSPAVSGLEQPGVLDAFAHDVRTDRVILAMFETRPWTEQERHTFQLQEKLNAYASFALDGEMDELYPALKGKRVCLQLRTVYEPDEKTLGLLQLIREQLELQGVDLETVLIGPEDGSCGCNPSGSSCCQGG